MDARRLWKPLEVVALGEIMTLSRRGREVLSPLIARPKGIKETSSFRQQSLKISPRITYLFTRLWCRAGVWLEGELEALMYFVPNPRSSDLTG